MNCDLHPSASLSPVWVTLVCGCIKVGNALYDQSHASLPQCYLSEAEAAIVAGDRLNVSIGQTLPARVCDPHQPSTLSCHLLQLCNDQSIRYTLFIANEKTVLFIGMQNEKVVLVDSHQHGQNSTAVILGETTDVENFIETVQATLGLHSNRYGNLVAVYF